jgi:hypothetical protein
MFLGLTELIVLLFLLIVPIFIISFVEVLKNDFKGNDKLIWLIAVIFVPFLGPICYFLIGRKLKIRGKNDEGNT